MANKVPIIVVTALPPTAVASKRFDVRAVYKPKEVVAKRGDVKGAAEVAIVHPPLLTKQSAVFAALFLRNAGRTSVIGSLEEVPYDLIERLHSFTMNAKNLGDTVRTETLMTEDAEALFGNITDTIILFEETYL